MLRVVLLIVVIGLAVYCLIDLAQSWGLRVRVLPPWMWAVLVVIAPIVGPTAWLLAGRPEPYRRILLVQAPDDDDDFLRGLG